MTAYQLKEEDADAYLEKEKPESVKEVLIKHYGLSQEEMKIYPFADLIQMGIGMKNV